MYQGMLPHCCDRTAFKSFLLPSGMFATQCRLLTNTGWTPVLRSQPTNLPTSETSFGSIVPLLTTTSRNENIAAFNRAMDSF
jgi:hypothetical protein